MKLHELLQKIDQNDISIQGVAGSICGVRQKSDHVELTIATNAVTTKEVASGDFDSVLILVRIDRDAYENALN